MAAEPEGRAANSRFLFRWIARSQKSE